MEIRARSAPAITRVHTLHRIRTVVNYVEKLLKAKAAEIDDIAIANHLIDTHLSKPTTYHFRDQIGRRARDHLETARYLGLLYRLKFGNKFKHFTSTQGNRLSSYQFDDECPKDFREESILIDKVCRMKIANTSYMQTPREYGEFRSRICLNILGALNISESDFSLFQIGYILGEKILDPFTHKKKLERLVRFVNSKKFEKRYILASDDRRTIRRDTTPFLDWCAQLDLIRLQDDEYVKITDRGKRMLDYYGSLLPIWYCDLKKAPSVAAAALLLINFFKMSKENDAIGSLITIKTHWRLFKIEVDEVLKEALGKNYNEIVNDSLLTDFTFQYDIPPEEFDEVKSVMHDLLTKIGYQKLSVDSVIRFLETYSVKALSPEFKTEADQLEQEIAKREKVRIKVKATSIYSQIRSPYEATIYTLFKAIETQDFKVEKYQAQLEELFTGNKRWEKFAKNNPDLLLINDFIGLVECKSTKEWGETLSLRKGILSEITTYNVFCEAIKELGYKRRPIILISYEGRIQSQDIDEIEKMMKENFPNVIIITSKALQRSLVNISFKNELKEMIKMAKFKRSVVNE